MVRAPGLRESREIQIREEKEEETAPPPFSLLNFSYSLGVREPAPRLGSRTSSRFKGRTTRLKGRKFSSQGSHILVSKVAISNFRDACLAADI